MLTPSNTTKRLACVGVTALLLCALLLIVLLFIGLFTGRLPYKIVFPSYMLILSVGWLIAGIRKVRQQRASGRRVSWYTQPGILFAIGMFLYFPGGVIIYMTDVYFPVVDAILIALLILSSVLFIAAMYFGIRRFTHPFEDL